MTASWPGRATPLGATPDGSGTNFTLWSSTADSVELCLLDDTETRIPLTEKTHHVWHGYVPGVGPGQRYGFRVAGDPGLRHDPAKLLLDPYARAIDGTFSPDDPVFAPGADSAAYVPRSVVVADAEPATGPRPAVPWDETVIYEMHVRGFTARHPGVPEQLRGTYAGLAHESVLEYLTNLGITAVELLPVHHFLSEPAVTKRGLCNYWGYNSIGFMAPHGGYSAAGTRGEQVAEFREMVAAFHAAGIEVLLDVVYNHTAEAGTDGPTLAFRGIDDRTYYRLLGGDYVDFTGCGNTPDVRQPQVLRLVMDSLRYWVQQLGVDGFRFDLAPALARGESDVERLSPFFDAIYQDPIVGAVKLIAEPWDLGPDGYQVGRFPPPWAEWNGRFRDTVRDFWRGHSGGVRDLGYRLTGSSDLYYASGREPFASINFVTSHDGFTAPDLAAYNNKHNDANGEHGADGTNDNRSWNCGTEGPTTDPEINSLRRRQVRNLLATTLLSAGVPMLLAGDEILRTQGGNNNAYCQDNETSWLDWDVSADGHRMREFVAALIALRRKSPVLRQRMFFEGRPAPGGDSRKDLAWFRTDGAEMTDADWLSPDVVTLGMYVDGRGIRERGRHGDRVVDDTYLLLLHSGSDDTTVTLPGAEWANAYDVVLDTATDEVTTAAHKAAAEMTVSAHSLVLLRAILGDHA
jgi:glycogen operon protein